MATARFSQLVPSLPAEAITPAPAQSPAGGENGAPSAQRDGGQARAVSSNATSAVMVIDAQKFWTDGNPRTTERIRTEINTLREQGHPIIWAYSQEKPDANSPFVPQPPMRVGDNKLGDLPALFKGYGKFADGQDPVIQPAPGDWIVAKDNADAFTNPHLAPFLRQQGIKDLNVAGFMQGYCVFATADSAVNKEGIHTTMLTDLSADKYDRPDGGDGNFERSGIPTATTNSLRQLPGPKAALPIHPAAP